MQGGNFQLQRRKDLVCLLQIVMDINQQQGKIGIFQRALHGHHHFFMKLVFRINDPWCVRKDDLILVSGQNSLDAMTGSLHLR